MPGPGAYASDFSPIKYKDPQWRMGTSKRVGLAKITNSPPPNTYNPDYSKFANRTVSYGFGSSRRANMGKSHAGPSMQAYNLPPAAFEKRGFAMGIKLENQGALNVKGGQQPGPGNYAPNYRATTPGASAYSIMGRHAMKQRYAGPDPGAYDLNFNNLNKAPAFGFGGGGKQRVDMASGDAPGPGNYKVPTKIATKPQYVSNVQEEKYRYV